MTDQTATLAAEIGSWAFDDPCPNVIVIGARGSGQERDATGAFTPASPTLGVGPEVYGFSKKLADILQPKGLSVKVLANSYPAVPVEYGLSAILDAADAGSTATRVLVAVVAQKCGSTTKVILAGYSQGALATKGGADFVKIEHRPILAGLVLLADPQFDPNGGGTLVGGFSPDKGGILGRVAIPEFIQNRAISACLLGDLVCQGQNFSDIVVGALLSHIHTAGYQDVILLTGIAAVVASKITGTTATLDLVFVIDTTGSMGDDIAAVKAAANRIVDELAAGGRDYRIGLVDYKDHPVSGGGSSDYPTRVMLQLSNDKPSIVGKINELGASGGGDTPESVYSGVISGLRLDWRPGAQRKIILMGDAPPKDPEPVTNYTFSKVVTAALSRGLIVLPIPTVPSESASSKPFIALAAEGDVPVFDHPVQIYPVEIGGGGGPLFEQLAEATGGTHFNAAQASDVVDAILGAIEVITGGSAIVPVSFDLSAQAGTSGLNATGRVIGDKTEGYVVGRIRGQPIPNTTITEAGLTRREGQEVLIVRFSASGEPWELRFRRATETVEICGPLGCETGTGRAIIGQVPDPVSTTAVDGSIATPTSITSTSVGSTSTTVAPTLTTTTSTTTPVEATTSTTSTTTAPSMTTTAAVTEASCAQLQAQVDKVDDRSLRRQLLVAMRELGCPLS